MRAWPAGLAERYPVAPGRLKDRPWWEGRSRRDGLTIRSDAERGGGGYTVPAERIGDSWRYEQVENAAQAQEAWDRVRPIPHPGFRVGQVWAEVTDRKAAVSIVECTGHWYLGGSTQGLTQAALEVLLQGAFLVADPACPWLAPWAPCDSGAAGSKTAEPETVK